MTRRYGDAFASLCPAAGQYRLPALGLHALAESVDFAPFATVWLKCTFRHTSDNSPG